MVNMKKNTGSISIERMEFIACANKQRCTDRETHRHKDGVPKPPGQSGAEAYVAGLLDDLDSNADLFAQGQQRQREDQSQAHHDACADKTA